MADDEKLAQQANITDNAVSQSEVQIDDERRYTTKEAGELLGLNWRTVVGHIRRKNIIADRELERRGPVYYIFGSEIKRFKDERRSSGRPAGAKNK